MKATPPARALALLVDVLDRFWGPIVVAVVAVLEVVLFAPRGMFVGMIVGGCVAAGSLVTWLGGGAGWRPR